VEVLVAGAAVSRTPLFPTLLGDRFAALALPVRRLHEAAGARRYLGHASVERGAGPLGRLAATMASLPPASAKTDLAVDIETLGDAERWTRHFGTHAMRSTLRQDGELLCERLGPAHFHFELVVRDGALLWIVRRVAVLGTPLPVRWFAGVAAREFAEDGAYRFDVAAALPLAGLLVRYRGTLVIP
jgi:Domain of unknown function (DUF4166)